MSKYTLGNSFYFILLWSCILKVRAVVSPCDGSLGLSLNIIIPDIPLSSADLFYMIAYVV